MMEKIGPDQVSQSGTQESILEEDDEFLGEVVDTDETELDLYLKKTAIKNIKTDQDVVDYWKKNKNAYPLLSRAVRIIWSVPASSATSKRGFSVAGITVNIRRTRLKSDTTGMLLFVRSADRLPVFAEDDDSDNDEED